MILYNPEGNNILEVLISGSSENPTVELNNGLGWISTANSESAISFIIHMVDDIDSGELILLCGENYEKDS